MIRKLFVLIAFFSIAFISKAQSVQAGEHQLGDWRNFAEQTQVTLQLNPFGKKTNTAGSQFLFDDWVKGKIVNTNGVEFTEGLYNFNKINQNLYVEMKDTISTVAFLVDRDQLRSIFLSDGNQSYLLEKVAALEAGSFYRVLAKGNKYSLYSQVKTKFIASDYETNGIVSSGNNYDEYKDEFTYWIVFADGSAHPVALKKKPVRSILENEKEKVEEFYKANADQEQNESFFSKLIESLNQ